MDLERMGDEWHSQLQAEFIANTAKNIRIRVQAIERIANRLLQEAIHDPPHCERFVIENNVYGEIMKKLKPEISEKSKVQVKECRIKKATLNDYRTTARNRLNRNKPKFLGNFVFADIIFDKLYTHIVQQCRARHLDDIQIIALFIDILTHIFDAKVNFTQTKPQPVIPYKCLVDGNALKSACINLLKYYSIAIPAVTPSDGQKKAKQSEKAKKEYDKIVQTIKCELKQTHVLSSRPLPFQVFVDEHHNAQTNAESNEIYDGIDESQLLQSDTTNNNNAQHTTTSHAQYLRGPPLDSFPSANSYSDESLQIPFSSGSSSNTSVSSMNNDNLPPMIQFNHSMNMNPMHEIGDLPPIMRLPSVDSMFYPDTIGNDLSTIRPISAMPAFTSHTHSMLPPSNMHIGPPPPGPGPDLSAGCTLNVIEDVQDMNALPFNPSGVVFGASANDRPSQRVQNPQRIQNPQPVQMSSIPLTNTYAHNTNHYAVPAPNVPAYGPTRGSTYNVHAVRHSPYHRVHVSRPQTLAPAPWREHRSTPSLAGYRHGRPQTNRFATLPIQQQSTPIVPALRPEPYYHHQHRHEVPVPMAPFVHTSYAPRPAAVRHHDNTGNVV